MANRQKKPPEDLDKEILVTLCRQFRMKLRDFDDFKANKIEKSKLVKEGKFYYWTEEIIPWETTTTIPEEENQ